MASIASNHGNNCFIKYLFIYSSCDDGFFFVSLHLLRTFTIVMYIFLHHQKVEISTNKKPTEKNRCFDVKMID